mmetsp:Transcript_5598/g.15651  ORF Transcript_5598/g.15651 Transcript_5598/m.15651 type:complete len:423 (+) Transcript_5598:245-1513(+)|eukprot:CAMPEP_0117667738 /NCGR_PEP_ID=MMETSP0804-20121206/11144_1 /TAXON_ID=1074897 /ORGANISM="Tetraselmis astigmatica, Strain CCMP880" /LENGTH=422 /DNA_ID=CAMNT_0005475519 /DNA_START=228 /DNA_END=1496 /DNA_ORIENTATION=-
MAFQSTYPQQLQVAVPGFQFQEAGTGYGFNSNNRQFQQVYSQALHTTRTQPSSAGQAQMHTSYLPNGECAAQNDHGTNGIQQPSGYTQQINGPSTSMYYQAQQQPQQHYQFAMNNQQASMQKQLVCGHQQQQVPIVSQQMFQHLFTAPQQTSQQVASWLHWQQQQGLHGNPGTMQQQATPDQQPTGHQAPLPLHAAPAGMWNASQMAAQAQVAHLSSIQGEVVQQNIPRHPKEAVDGTSHQLETAQAQGSSMESSTSHAPLQPSSRRGRMSLEGNEWGDDRRRRSIRMDMFNSLQASQEAEEETASSFHKLAGFETKQSLLTLELSKSSSQHKNRRSTDVGTDHTRKQNFSDDGTNSQNARHVRCTVTACEGNAEKLYRKASKDSVKLEGLLLLAKLEGRTVQQQLEQSSSFFGSEHMMLEN